MNHIVQPVGKIKLTNVAVIRYEVKGKRFEIACYKNKIVNWRNGIETDIDEVLQIPFIFQNTSKGVTAKNEDLMKCFGTTDTAVISRIMLEKGTEQISGKEREHQLQTITTEVATYISEMCYNPDTDAVFTVTMIQRAMKDAHVNLKLNQPAKKQALEVIRLLKKTMRIERKQMVVKIVADKKDAENIENYCEKQCFKALSKDESNGTQTYVYIIDTQSYKDLIQFVNQKKSRRCEIVQRQYIPVDNNEDNNCVEVANETPVEEKKEVVDKLESFKFRCSTCEAGFASANEHREHFKSDWHRFNLKRKNKGLPVMSETEFDSLDENDREFFLKQDSVAT